MSEQLPEQGSDPGLLGSQLYGHLAGLLAPAGSLDQTSALLVEPCGRDLDPADFGTDPDGVGAEAFADLVNVIPVPGATFVDSSRRLDDVADMVLLNACPDPGGPPAAAILVDQARADLALMARGSETPGDLYHPAVPAPQKWWDTSEPWAPVSFVIGSTAPPPPPLPPEIATVEAPPLRWTVCPPVAQMSSDVRLAASGRLNLGTISRQTVIRSEVLQPPVLQPRVIHPEAIGLRNLRLATPLMRRRDDGPDGPDLPDDPGGPDGPVARRARFRDLVRIHQVLVDDAPTAPVAPPASGFELTFSYRVVSFTRPWWHPELFAQPGWTMPGFSAGAVSTGTATGNTGLIGAVTTRMLLVRDLFVKGSWGSADSAAAAGATKALGTLGLGPFALTGDVGWDGTTLSRPGVAVVAWLVAVTPEFPR